MRTILNIGKVTLMEDLHLVCANIESKPAKPVARLHVRPVCLCYALNGFPNKI